MATTTESIKLSIPVNGLAMNNWLEDAKIVDRWLLEYRQSKNDSISRGNNRMSKEHMHQSGSEWREAAICHEYRSLLL